MEVTPKNKDKKPAGPTDHLANERTFLAWIRTSISLMGFGFVIVKFALFIRQLSVILDKQVVVPKQGYSAEIGVIMVVLGAIITLLAFIRYRNVEKHLNNNNYYQNQWLPLLVTLCIVVACILLVIYLLPNVKF
jgi:putative membrane protein